MNGRKAAVFQLMKAKGKKMNEEEFHGISLHWMREMWRDCKDREEQLVIFRDMTGAGTDEILQALGTDWKSKRKERAGSRRPWTVEEEEKLREMKAAGIREKEIAAELGRTMNAVHARWCILHPEAYGKAEDLPEEAVGAEEAEEAFPAVPEPDAETVVAEEAEVGLRPIPEVPDPRESSADETVLQVIEPEDMKPDSEALFAAVGEYIGILRAKEAVLQTELDAVRAELEMYRLRLRDLIELAGGALTQ